MFLHVFIYTPCTHLTHNTSLLVTSCHNSFPTDATFHSLHPFMFNPPYFFGLHNNSHATNAIFSICFMPLQSRKDSCLLFHTEIFLILIASCFLGSWYYLSSLCCCYYSIVSFHLLEPRVYWKQPLYPGVGVRSTAL